jgi:hypothetical protein
MSTIRTIALLAVAATLAACADDATTTTGPSLAASASVQRSLAAARAATARYHDVSAALADGYVNTHECVAIPGAGMGVHFVNGARIGDPALDPAQPEVLVYEPQANGTYRLVALEYMIPRAMWDATSPGTRPVLFGHSFDEGPMDSYALHAWVWRENANGMFAHFNPKVSCPTVAGGGAHARH